MRNWLIQDPEKLLLQCRLLFGAGIVVKHGNLAETSPSAKAGTRCFPAVKARMAKQLYLWHVALFQDQLVTLLDIY